MLLFVCQISSVKLWCYWLWRIEMSLVLSYSLCSVWSFVRSSSFFALSSFGTHTLFDIQYLRANKVWCSDLTCTLQGYEGVTIATSQTEAGFVQVVLTDQENGMKLGLMVHDTMFPAFMSLQMIFLLSRNMWSLCTVNNVSSLLTFASGFVKWWPTVFRFLVDSLNRLLSLTKRNGRYTMHIPHYILSAATRSSPIHVFIPRSLNHW